MDDNTKQEMGELKKYLITISKPPVIHGYVCRYLKQKEWKSGESCVGCPLAFSTNPPICFITFIKQYSKEILKEIDDIKEV